jgi:uncharacterized protein YjbI with pentapeptide repeats
MIIGNNPAFFLSPPRIIPDATLQNVNVLTEKLDALFSNHMDVQQEHLTGLAHWLLCCKNLWPETFITPVPDSVPDSVPDLVPFSLNKTNQQFRPCVAALNRAVAKIIGASYEADVLTEKLMACIAASDTSDWKSLQNEGYAGAHILAAAAAGEWPRTCLLMAMQTFNMDKADLRHANLRGVDLNNLQFCNVDFREADFRDADFNKVKFDDCNLRYTDFRKCELNVIEFSKCDLSYAEFGDALLNDVLFLEDTSLRVTNFGDAELQYVDFNNIDCSNADFRDSCLKDVCFYRCNMQECSFQETVLKNVSISVCDISRAKIHDIFASGVYLTNVYYPGLESNIPMPVCNTHADFVGRWGLDTVAEDDPYQYPQSTCTESESENDYPAVTGKRAVRSRERACDIEKAPPSAWIRAQAIALSVMTLSQPSTYIYLQ